MLFAYISHFQKLVVGAYRHTPGILYTVIYSERKAHYFYLLIFDLGNWSLCIWTICGMRLDSDSDCAFNDLEEVAIFLYFSNNYGMVWSYACMNGWWSKLPPSPFSTQFGSLEKGVRERYYLGNIDNLSFYHLFLNFFCNKFYLYHLKTGCNCIAHLRKRRLGRVAFLYHI